MKFTSNKQIQLKIVLLVALAANLSWEPALQGLKEMNLASGGEAMVGGAPAQTSTVSATDKQIPITPGSTSPDPDSSLKPATAAVTQKTTKKFGPEAKTICDVHFEVHYYERVKDNETSTEVEIAKRYPREVLNLTPRMVYKGSFETVIENAESKAQIEDHITKAVQNHPKYKEQCAPQAEKTAKEGSDEDSTVAEADSKDIDELEALRSKRSRGPKSASKRKSEIVKDCRVRGSDRGLDGSTRAKRLECNLKKLDSITVNLDQDSESKIEKEQKKALESMKKIIEGDVMADLDALLGSGDEDEAELGAMALDKMISKVEDIGVEYELKDSSIDKLVRRLESAEVGGEISRTSNLTAKEIEELGSESKDAWQRYLSGDNESMSEVSKLRNQQAQLYYELMKLHSETWMPRLQDLYRQQVINSNIFENYQRPFANFLESFNRSQSTTFLGLTPYTGTPGSLTLPNLNPTLSQTHSFDPYGLGHLQLQIPNDAPSFRSQLTSRRSNGLAFSSPRFDATALGAARVGLASVASTRPSVLSSGALGQQQYNSVLPTQSYSSQSALRNPLASPSVSPVALTTGGVRFGSRQ